MKEETLHTTIEKKEGKLGVCQRVNDPISEADARQQKVDPTSNGRSQSAPGKEYSRSAK